MERYKNDQVGGYMQIPIAEKTVTSELSGDFTLPDYQPEIKRLLRVTASVLPPAKYVGGREAELEGNVDYFVLYTGSDNEVYCAPLTTDYKLTVPVDADDDHGAVGMQICASVRPEAVSGRVTSPRKLSIKCRLRATAYVSGDIGVENGLGNSGEELEVLYGKADVTSVFCGVGEMLKLSDEMIVNGDTDQLRVISADGRVLVSEASVTEGAVNCRGELYLKLLMSREDGGEPYTALRKLPFSQTIAVDGAHSGYSSAVRGTVGEMNITVDDGRVGIDAGVILEAESYGGRSVEYVKDAYSAQRNGECEYMEAEYIKDGNAFFGNFTLSDSASLEEAGMSNSDIIIDACGEVIPEEYAFENGRCRITGKARFSLLTKRDGEYGIADMELPFKYDVKTADSATEAICEANVVSCRARADGDRVGIDAEIGIFGKSYCRDKVKMPCRVELFDLRERPKGEIRICYPSSSDSLWSIAKRYGVPAKSLCERNALAGDLSPDSAEALGGATYIIV